MAYIWAPYAGSEIGPGAGDVDLYEVGPEYRAVCHLLCITNPGMVPVVFKVLGIKSRKFLGPKLKCERMWYYQCPTQVSIQWLTPTEDGLVTNEVSCQLSWAQSGSNLEIYFWCVLTVWVFSLKIAIFGLQRCGWWCLNTNRMPDGPTVVIAHY